MFFAGRDLVSPQRSPGITRLQYLSQKYQPKNLLADRPKMSVHHTCDVRLGVATERCDYALRLENVRVQARGRQRQVSYHSFGGRSENTEDAVEVLILACRLCRSNSAIDRPTAHLGQGLCRLQGSPEAAQLWRWHP